MSSKLCIFAVVVALFAASVEGTPCATTGYCFFCTSCNSCYAGSYIDYYGINSCKSVPGGYYSPGGTYTSPGIPWATCTPGTYVTQSPAASQNRGCTSCPSGKTSHRSNAGSCTEINGCVYPTQNKCNAVDSDATCKDVNKPKCLNPTKVMGNFPPGAPGVQVASYDDVTAAQAASFNIPQYNICALSDGQIRGPGQYANGGSGPGKSRSTQSGYNCYIKCGGGSRFKSKSSQVLKAEMAGKLEHNMRHKSMAAVERHAVELEADLSVPYECVCSAGYVATATSCVNQDGCTGNTCASKADKAATCVDAAPPATGFSCTCSAGYEDDGGICKPINSCDAGVVTTCGLHGDTGAICNNKAPPAVGNTCSCSTGYSSTIVNGTTTCKDTNGCKGSPCKASGDKTAACGDKVAPLTGHSCTCTIGYEVEGTTCIDTPGCSVKNNKCSSRGDTAATCFDVAAPGTGSTCACSPGRVNQNGVCTDMNGCAKNMCTDGGDTEATCKDAKAPATGFSCECSRGYLNQGGICKPIDSCTHKSCGASGDNGAICKNLAPPAIGNTCGCTVGYNQSCVKEKAVTDACVDKKWGGATLDGEGKAISGEPWTCLTYSQKTWCADGKKGPAWQASWKWGTSKDGSTADKECCVCGGGNTTQKLPAEDAAAKDDKTCTCLDINGCLGAPCADGGDEAAACIDEPAPKTGHTCVCNMGYASVNGTCMDINGCSDKPCTTKDKTATCADVAAPAPGYAHLCNCSAGYHTQRGSCININGCANNTCNSAGDTASKCTDIPPPATGFKCGCSAGYTEIGGVCVDINGCKSSPCIKAGNDKATCMDIKAPGRGNTCNCTAGYASLPMGHGGSKGMGRTCANIDSCTDNKKCSSSGDTGAECVDLKPPSSTFKCTCSAHFHFDKASMSCHEDICMTPLVKNGAYGGDSCKNGGCPMVGNNVTIDATKIVCDEGFKRTAMTAFTCKCGGNRETCTSLSNACIANGAKGPSPDGKNCATFNRDLSKCCAAGGGKKCAFTVKETCKKKGAIPDGSNKCANPGMETAVPEELPPREVPREV